MHTSQLLKILGETADGLKNREAKIPKELLELYVYCKKYSTPDKFKIKDFNQLFERCKASLNRLADGGYLGFNDLREREAFFVKLDDLRKKIENEQAAESESEQLFKRLYKNYVLVYLSLLEIRRNPSHDEALRQVTLSPSILARDVHSIISEFPHLLEHSRKQQEQRQREEVILNFLLRGNAGTTITHIFRLQRFILDYCSRLKQFTICQSFLKYGKHFCRAVPAFFETFRLIGVEFHVSIRFFEKPPSDIDYEDAIAIGGPIFNHFEPEGTRNVLYKIASSDWNRYNGTVGDLSLLGCKSDKFEDLNSKTRLYCWYA